MKTFTVRKRSTGQEYNVRLCPVTINTQYPELGVSGSHEKDAEIEIDGQWHRCHATHVHDKNTRVPAIEVSKYLKDTLAALGVPTADNNVYIVASQDWAPLYLEMLEEAKQEFARIANEAVFTKITFMYHTTHKYMSFRWDSDIETSYIAYNDTINKLKDALTYIDPNDLKNYQTGSDYDDYSISYYYEVPFSDIDKIIELSLPGLEKAAQERQRVEEVVRKNAERKANIEAGCIYFHCESAPHNEDLSDVILNSPAPNLGAFTLQHKLNEQLFSQIRPYARYYSAEFLEDCDMFTSSPGYRFSVQAIEKLLKLGKRVFVDDQEIIKN